MKIVTQDLGLKIYRILGQFIVGTDHLHYGFWTDDLNIELANIPKAQNNYTEFLLKHIPAAVNSILDIGCGVGENAKKLLQAGYKVDCVSPSKYLSSVTKEKIGEKSEIFESMFEDIDTDKKYDMTLFSESFQYIKMDKAMEKCRSILKEKGFILISDFFKIPAEGKSPMGGGHKLKKFFKVMEEYKFRLIEDIDITDQTAPNLELVDKFLQQVIVPLHTVIIDEFKSNYKRIFPIIMFFLNLFFKKRFEKLHFKYLSGERNAENFKRFKTYRLFVYQKI